MLEFQICMLYIHGHVYVHVQCTCGIRLVIANARGSSKKEEVLHNQQCSMHHEIENQDGSKE